MTGGSIKNSHKTDMRSMLGRHIFASLNKREMLRPGDRLGVAVSGGADSVALLLSLLDLRNKLGIVLSVVHFNHKLRGKASDADEAFVTISVLWWNPGPARESRWRTRPTIRRRQCLSICSVGPASWVLVEFIP